MLFSAMVHPCITHAIMGAVNDIGILWVQMRIVLYLSISIALLTAQAFRKRSRPQQLTLSEFTRRSL